MQAKVPKTKTFLSKIKLTIKFLNRIGETGYTIPLQDRLNICWTITTIESITMKNFV